MKKTAELIKLYNGIEISNNFPYGEDWKETPYLQNPPSVIDVSIGRQLFVDDILIEKTTLVFEYHKAKKYDGNPVFYPQAKWEKYPLPVACPKSGGVWYDEEDKLFKMWYEAGWLTNMAYAISNDGIHWTRPDLGIVSGTNIILPYGGYNIEKLTGDLQYLRPDSTTVWIDYAEENKGRKYKLFLRNPGAEYPGIVATSSDGIHFENFKFSSDTCDRSTIFYNPFRKKWVYSIRACGISSVNNVDYVRHRHYRECDDFLEGANWNAQEELEWLCADDADVPNQYIGFKPQLYNVDAVGYESIMLGMFQIHYGPKNEICEKSGAPKITELMPIFSRDGFHFTRPCRESFINSSIFDGAWDRGYVQSVGGVTIINGDELWIYYAGFCGDKTHKGEFWTSNGMYSGGATGIAKLRRDGFVSIGGKGSLLTRKLIYHNRQQMRVNFVGSIKISLLDLNEETLVEGSACGDYTDFIIDFGNFDLQKISEKPFRIRFDVEGKLYSFHFCDYKGESFGARAAGMVKK